jgi:hypothetical protein
LRRARVCARSHTRRAQVRRDSEAARRVGGIGANDDRNRSSLGRGRNAGLSQRQHQAVEADPEADPGSRPATQQLDQADVPATAADGLLLAFATGHVELECGPRVVVEAAVEPRLQPERHAERVEVRPDRCEVLRARRAQPVGDLRRRGVQGGHRRVLRIEQSQHVPVEPAAFERR